MHTIGLAASTGKEFSWRGKKIVQKERTIFKHGLIIFALNLTTSETEDTPEKVKYAQ